MAVLKKIRSRLFPPPLETPPHTAEARRIEPVRAVVVAGVETRYDVRPLTFSQIDEVWQLDQRCFMDGEAYSRDTFEYLLTSPEAIAYRTVITNGAMVGFIVGLIEPDQTGHITTIGVAPEHRRRRLAQRMMHKVEDGFHRRHIRTVRLEVRSVNTGAQQLYRNLGYTATQRLPRYYSNGGDGLLMVKPIG